MFQVIYNYLECWTAIEKGLVITIVGIVPSLLFLIPIPSITLECLMYGANLTELFL